MLVCLLLLFVIICFLQIFFLPSISIAVFAIFGLSGALPGVHWMIENGFTYPFFCLLLACFVSWA